MDKPIRLIFTIMDPVPSFMHGRTGEHVITELPFVRGFHYHLGNMVSDGYFSSTKSLGGIIAIPEMTSFPGPAAINARSFRPVDPIR